MAESTDYEFDFIEDDYFGAFDDNTDDSIRKTLTAPTGVIWLHETGLEYPDGGFAWRKHGTKGIIGSKYSRSYYRCFHRNFRGCLARKSVQRSDDDPLTFEVTYHGTHSCGRHLESSYQKHGDSIKRVPYDLFPKLQHLRTLDLHGTNISELPDSISYLSSLHYLDVSETPLRLLPESIGNLQHLQTLKLESCFNFCRLPKCTNKLVNLRHLDLDILGQLTSMPVGMGSLTSLKTLKAFILGKGEGSGARELKHLTNICGSFCISRLENISSSGEAREVEISSKKHLNKLELWWEGHQNDLALHEEILDCLQPHSTLKELQVSFYNGCRFPIWMSNSCLPNIVSITLYECKSCGYLPSLGGLQSLKSLVFFDLPGVRSIDHNFCKYEGIQIGPAFPKLEKLKIDGMPNLEQWTGVENGDFPCLLQLSVGRCPKLLAIPMLSLLSFLNVLEICECDELQSFPKGKLPSKLDFLIITDCPLIKELCIKPQSEEWSKIEHIPSIFIDHEEISST